MPFFSQLDKPGFLPGIALRGVLEQQVRRMIEDPKSDAFIEQFFGQWPAYGELALNGGPDRKTFPVFTDYLRDSMVAESTLFIGSLLREDQSLLKTLPFALGRELRCSTPAPASSRTCSSIEAR